MNLTLTIKRNELDQGIEKIHQYLLQAKIVKNEITKNLLAIEDILVCMFDHAAGDSVKVVIRSILGNVNLHMTAKGDTFTMEDVRKDYAILEEDPEIKAVLEHYMSKVLGDGIEISNRHGVNHCKIHIAKSKYKNLIRILSALLLGLVCLSILLPQFGMPAEGISIVMGLYTIVGMALAATNVTGDAVVALLVAKSEQQLDYDMYNAN